MHTPQESGAWGGCCDLPRRRVLCGASAAAARPAPGTARIRTRRMPESSSSLLSRWHSEQCQGFYGPSLRTASPYAKQTVTREDRCAHGGRANASLSRGSEVNASAQEIMIVPQLNLVYLLVRKAASTSIERALRAVFNANFSSCGGVETPATCGRLVCQRPATIKKMPHLCRRCTTL